jgi:hypothetical protein
VALGQDAQRSSLGRFRGDDDIARDDLGAQVLDLLADVTDARWLHVAEPKGHPRAFRTKKAFWQT